MSPEVNNKQSHIVNGLILYKLAFFSFNLFGMYMFLISVVVLYFLFLWEEKGGLQYMLALIA